jgi:hypothetical protein
MTGTRMSFWAAPQQSCTDHVSIIIHRFKERQMSGPRATTPHSLSRRVKEKP